MNTEEPPRQNTQDLFQGNFPGMRELLENFQTVGLGRGIGFYNRSRQDNPFVHVGQVLPLNREENQHLILMLNGDIAIIEPNNPQDLEQYQKAYGSNETPKEIAGTDNSTPAEILERILLTSLNCKLVVRNNKPENAEKINEAVAQAIKVAAEIRQDALKTRAETASNAISQFGKLFNGNPPDATLLPPTATPKST